jgi:LemA protein
MVVSERYPELKATQAFANLQTELSSTENKIATERSRYNEVVKNYNTKITNFPNVIYAGMLGFKERGFFQATDAEKVVPNVDFQCPKRYTIKKYQAGTCLISSSKRNISPYRAG